MTMFRSLLFLLVFAFVVKAEPAPTFQYARIDRGTHSSDPDFAMYGRLQAGIGDKPFDLAEKAHAVWLAPEGDFLVYTDGQGKGGFENEGQGLWLVKPGAPFKPEKIAAFGLYVDNVIFVQNSKGQTYLVVQMSDGGLGAHHLAVVNPANGNMKQFRFSDFAGMSVDAVIVSEYGNTRFDIWENFGKVNRPAAERLIKFNILDSE